MSRPSKPMPKNSNSKFMTRNNKQDIFSKISKMSNAKIGMKVLTNDENKDSNDNRETK